MKNLVQPTFAVKAPSRSLPSPLEQSSETIGYTDSRYPAQFRKIGSAPATFFLKGALTSDASRLAVIGTRRPSQRALALTDALVSSLVEIGYSIVSGLALGIDAQAHKAALKAGGHTVAILPSGIERIYPARHERLAEKILLSSGALISERSGSQSPEKWSFLLRNRLITGSSDGLFLVEGALKSGSMHTVKEAILQRRPVFVPVFSRGDREALGEAAKVLVGMKGLELARLLGAKGRYKEILEYDFEDRPVATLLPLDELWRLPKLLTPSF